MSYQATVFIVDSDPRARKSIEALVRTMHFDAETFASAEAFLLRRNPDQQGCAVVDCWLPDMTGLELLTHLAQQNDPLPVIMTGARVPTRTVVHAMKTDAVTFLEKPYPADELCATLPAAMAINRQRRERDQRVREGRRRMATLTVQERQVLDLIFAGLPNKVIAKRLGVSLRTVEYRRHDIFTKTGTESLPELVRLATEVDLTGQTVYPAMAGSRGRSADDARASDFAVRHELPARSVSLRLHQVNGNAYQGNGAARVATNDR